MAEKSSKKGVSQPSYNVKLVKNVLIPMKDGVNLAADLYRPDSQGKFPAVVVYLPYRKDDQSEEYASKLLSYFAKRGYCGLFVDIRGTGSSEGRFQLNFDIQEQKDGAEALEWIADQQWCDGNIGMTGSSWGGSTSFLVAQQNPRHLKAIAPGLYGLPQGGGLAQELYSPGGSPVCLWAFGYNLNQLEARSCSPTTYQDKEGRWLRIWQEHIKNTPRTTEFLKNQTLNGFWKVRSIVPEKVKVPVFIWDGWRDVSNLFARWALEVYTKLRVPKRVIMGPWPHMLPDSSKPGPRIDFVYEILRWFDQWLKGRDTGILKEPPLTIYVERYVPPALELDQVPGEWRYENVWPLKRAVNTSFYLHPKGVLKKESCLASKREEADSYKYNPLVGITSGLTILGQSIGLPTDQRPDELHSQVYTSEPLEEDLEVTGMPDAILYGSSTSDIAMFAVKLCDVAPDGVSSMLGRGLLNATRRNSFERPEPLKPGKVYELKIPLSALSYVFGKGHRIRLDVASSDFPLLWPTPKNATNSIYHSKAHPSRIILPIVSSSNQKKAKPVLRPPPPEAESYKYPLPAKYEIKRDFLTSKVTISLGFDSTYANGMMTVNTLCDVVASELKPEDVRIEGISKVRVKGPSTITDVQAKVAVQSTLDAFHVFKSHEGKVNDSPYFTKTWTLSTPRVLL